jgi:hypothetical protein
LGRTACKIEVLLKNRFSFVLHISTPEGNGVLQVTASFDSDSSMMGGLKVAADTITLHYTVRNFTLAAW